MITIAHVGSKMRECKSGFLQTYINYTEQCESPEMFHLWSAVSIISMALRRKCFVKQGFFSCYPNHYIVLVSSSGRCRKTTASDIAIKLFRKSEITPITKGKVTARRLSQKLDEAIKEFDSSMLYIYSPELGKMLDSSSYVSGLMTVLTDMYDCPDEDKYETATQGIDNVKDAFINLLGCTVPSWLSSLPSDMVEGGLSSRCIFVVQNSPRKPNPRPMRTKAHYDMEAMLIHDLQRIGELEGEFKWTEKAAIYYDEWYIREYDKMDKEDIRLRAYFSRKGMHVLKLAMVLNASRSDGMLLDHTDIDNALELLKQVEHYMPTAFSGVSFSESTKHFDRLKEQLERCKGKATWSQLLKLNYYYMDKDELKKSLDTLVEANLVRMEIGQRGVRTYFLIANTL